ncbi:MAG: type III secretion system needle filament subunit SctF [Pseudomonas sp.]|jgi:type III secretion protein F|uniref:type III secretion system needle filament subunit SctF n=1 Tax=Pseudomonas sp. TaxID=306 RepID=UPI002383420C|nr:type III secretion system needle filament subunit SctF [Pseudomonas sp.]MDE1196467.1 type III secretion system needle filament subunit SctF [Pseudomonas sp.]
MAEVSPAPGFHDDFLGQQSEAFENGAVKLHEAMNKALEDLQADSSDPGLLAAYQSALGSYTVFRNVQTNTVKTFKDIDMSIVQAAR